MSTRTLRPRSGSSARALLLTILGEFVLPHGGAVWTSTVVRSLAALDIDERNARQAVARLADRGIVEAEKSGRRTRWNLSPTGRRLLVDGTERIYSLGTAAHDWDGRWLVVVCPIPEEQRERRHQLRAQLGFAGFGFVTAGVAISPHADRERAATTVLHDLDLVAGAMVFRAEAVDGVHGGELLHKAWDLDTIAARYDDFIAEFGRRTPRTPELRFAALVELVHEWRRFPFVDPEMPPRFLPRRWPGTRAKRVFDDRHATWAPDANAWYEAVEDGAPDARHRARSDERPLTTFDNFLTGSRTFVE